MRRKRFTTIQTYGLCQTYGLWSDFGFFTLFHCSIPRARNPGNHHTRESLKGFFCAHFSLYQTLSQLSHKTLSGSPEMVRGNRVGESRWSSQAIFTRKPFRFLSQRTNRDAWETCSLLLIARANGPALPPGTNERAGRKSWNRRTTSKLNPTDTPSKRPRPSHPSRTSHIIALILCFFKPTDYSS